MPAAERAPRARGGRVLVLATTIAWCAHAQEAPPRDPAPAEGTAADLGTVRVVGEYRPPVDPFAFDNPIDLRGTRFQRDWRDPVNLHDIGMRGGIVHIAINYGLLKAGEQITRLPGWKHQIRDATARPPPLDEEQVQRAMRVQEDQDR
jgi:hypothetical protein